MKCKIKKPPKLQRFTNNLSSVFINNNPISSLNGEHFDSKTSMVCSQTLLLLRDVKRKLMFTTSPWFLSS